MGNIKRPTKQNYSRDWFLKHYQSTFGIQLINYELKIVNNKNELETPN